MLKTPTHLDEHKRYIESIKVASSHSQLHIATHQEITPRCKHNLILIRNNKIN
jgi:hypothetical protein